MVGRKRRKPETTTPPPPPHLTTHQIVAYNFARARAADGWTQVETSDRLEPYLGYKLNQAGVSAIEKTYDSERRRNIDTAESSPSPAASATHRLVLPPTARPRRRPRRTRQRRPTATTSPPPTSSPSSSARRTAGRLPRPHRRAAQDRPATSPPTPSTTRSRAATARAEIEDQINLRRHAIRAMTLARPPTPADDVITQMAELLVELVKLTPPGMAKLRATDPDHALLLLAGRRRVPAPSASPWPSAYRKAGHAQQRRFDDVDAIDLEAAIKGEARRRRRLTVRGSVVQKGGRWYVKIELDPDPLTGRRRQKWHSGYRTKKDAERARTDLLSKLDRGEYVEPSHQTVGDFLVEWLDAIEPTVRPSTFDSYSRNIRNHVDRAHRRACGSRKVDAGDAERALRRCCSAPAVVRRRGPARATRRPSLERALELRAEGLTLVETAEQLRLEFAEADAHHEGHVGLAAPARAPTAAGEQRSRPGLDRRTVNYIHTILHRAFKDAVRWGRLARNPADAADPPRAGQKSDGIHAWDAATLRAFLDASQAVRAIGCTRCGSCSPPPACGAARRSACDGRDVDLDAGRLRIVQTITQVRSKVTVGEPKTARGRRPISLDGGTVAVLREPPHADARGAAARRPRLRRRGPRVPPARRRVPPTRRRQRDVPPPGRPVRPADA